MQMLRSKRKPAMRAPCATPISPKAWVTRALLAAVKLRPSNNWLPVWEPACGDGRMVSELSAAGYNVIYSDIHDYGFPGTLTCDFLRDELVPCHAVVTNPPFDLARECFQAVVAA